MKTAIPTLGADGWVSDPETVADIILSAFLTANHSQTNLFRNQSETFQKILMRNTNNIPLLEEDLVNALSTKFKAAFNDRSIITVDIVPLPDKPDQFSINFVGTVYSDDKEYTVAKLVETENSRVIKINNINMGS